MLGMTSLRLFVVSALIRKSFAYKFMFLAHLFEAIFKQDTDLNGRKSNFHDNIDVLKIVKQVLKKQHHLRTENTLNSK